MTAPTSSTTVVPTYPPFGKRMLMDNGWYAAIRRDDVELVTAPVVRVTPTGVRASDGTEVEAARASISASNGGCSES